MADTNNITRKSQQISIPNDLLNDLSSRFVINVPEEERIDLTRLCFQIELAHWFYLDFYCEENPKLTKYSVKEFIKIMFRHIPFLKKYTPQEVDSVIAEWKEYKSAVPTCGAILLDEELKNVLLVQSFYSKASYGFPRGKINIDELPHLCAIREVLEETGFDISSLIDENEYLEHTFNGQLIRLYIITGINLNTTFQPLTRNEIKSAEWFLVNQLPTGKKDEVAKTNLGSNNFFMVIPFVKALRKWISSRMQNSGRKSQEKSIVDKHTKQQQLFEQMTKSDLAKLRGNDELVKPSKSPKSMYSLPPRMMRQRNSKHENERRKNLFPESNQEIQTSKPIKILSKDSATQKDDSISYCDIPNGYVPISQTWKNFSLDTEAIVATFNISLRKLWPSHQKGS